MEKNDFSSEFVTFDQAVELRLLGYEERCFAVFHVESRQLVQQLYNDTRPFDKTQFMLAPLRQQVLKWFRKQHSIHGSICISGDETGKFTFRAYEMSYPHTTVGRGDEYDDEEAERVLIDDLIRIVKRRSAKNIAS